MKFKMAAPGEKGAVRGAERIIQSGVLNKGEKRRVITGPLGGRKTARAT